MRARKIVICMDGTGNEVGGRETNVLKLYKALAQSDTQITHYIQGVGTLDGQNLFGQIWQKFKGVLGLAFGLGLEDDVLEAYRFLCHSYQSASAKRAAQPKADPARAEDDQICIIGFSRGAYAARVLAGFIHDFGLVKPPNLHLIAPVFRAYRRVTDHDPNADPDVVFQALREYEPVLRPDDRVPIRFLGLFDTVSSMIRFRRIWHNLREYGSLVELGTHASVNRNPSVRIVAHALAIDERRSLFRAQRWATEGAVYYGNRYRQDSDKRRQYIRHRWFPGFHSDIGGSPVEDESGIGKTSLLWMLEALEKAERAADREDRDHIKDGDPPLPGGTRRPAGLVLRKGHLHWYLLADRGDKHTPGGRPYAPPGHDPIHDSIFGSGGPTLSWIWALLEILPKSLRRREWPSRRGWIWYLPLCEPRPIDPDDEIDPSAFARRDDPACDYDPVNLHGPRPGNAALGAKARTGAETARRGPDRNRDLPQGVSPRPM